MAIEERVSVNGAKLHVRIEGNEDAPVVVLVHSLGTNLGLWDAQVSALTPRYRVLRYDTRGHGKSSAPPGPYSMEMLADDLLALLAQFRIARAHIVGVSLGALTALAVALRDAPEIAGIAVCNTRADMPPDFARAIDERNETIRKDGLSSLAPALARRWLSPETVSSRPHVVEKVRKMVLDASDVGFLACTHAIKTSGLAARIAAIKRPTLFVASDQDGGLPVEVMRRMHLRVAGLQFAEIARAGHLSPLEQPEAFNRILLKFLDGLATRR